MSTKRYVCPKHGDIGNVAEKPLAPILRLTISGKETTFCGVCWLEFFKEHLEEVNVVEFPTLMRPSAKETTHNGKQYS